MWSLPCMAMTTTVFGLALLTGSIALKMENLLLTLLPKAFRMILLDQSSPIIVAIFGSVPGAGSIVSEMAAFKSTQRPTGSQMILSERSMKIMRETCG